MDTHIRINTLTMEYYSAVKKKPFVNESWGHQSKWNERNTNTTCSHLYVESEEAELIETESRWVVPGVGGGGEWRDVGQGLWATSYWPNKSRNLMYSMVTADDNTGLYTWMSPGGQVLNVVSTTTQRSLWEVSIVLTDLIAVITLQYIRASHHHVVHLKLAQRCVSVIAQ